MPRVAPVVPEETTMLCEGCGYILTGLPPDTRCPECAKPIAESVPQLRTPPDWEQPLPGHGSFRRFWATSAQVILRPGQFYRSLSTRTANGASRIFAHLHWAMASLLVGASAGLQARWLRDRMRWDNFNELTDWVLYALLFSMLSYLAIWLVARLSARLTAWEAAYRGLRLPKRVVARALDYHAAHYLPVAVVIFVTVVAYQSLLINRCFDARSGPLYLLVICAEVVLAAVYLFETYWIGMRRLMYANG